MSAFRIALNRFGRGARPCETVPADPRRWLLGQLDRYHPRPAAIAAAPSSTVAATLLADYYDERRTLRRQLGPWRQVRAAPAMESAPPVPPPMNGMAMTADPPEPATDLFHEARREVGRDARADYAASVAARADTAFTTDTPFVERLVHFWANHSQSPPTSCR